MVHSSVFLASGNSISFIINIKVFMLLFIHCFLRSSKNKLQSLVAVVRMSTSIHARTFHICIYAIQLVPYYTPPIATFPLTVRAFTFVVFNFLLSFVVHTYLYIFRRICVKI